MPIQYKKLGFSHSRGANSLSITATVLDLRLRDDLSASTGEATLGILVLMDMNKMLDELGAERDQLDEAILTLQRLAAGQGKRRGRPPAWMTTVKRRGRPPGSKNKPKDARA